MIFDKYFRDKLKLLNNWSWISMYSFEGDYRRKPQQNLSGASRRDERAVLLQHAQLERLKREQQRKKHDAALKIQAHIRSFVTRMMRRNRQQDAETWA